MKRTFLLLVVVICAGLLLVGLNLASYTQKPKEADVETSPNRSTFNSAGTGTNAFYSLLSETGRKVVRWQTDPAALRTVGDRRPSVFVIVGETRREYTEAEAADLFEWVAGGGRLVVFDRSIPKVLERNYDGWSIDMKESDADFSGADPTDAASMIGKMKAIKPTLPSVFAGDVNAVQLSKFASDILVSRRNSEYEAAPPRSFDTSSNAAAYESAAPVVLYSGDGRRAVVEAKYGSGRVIFVSDPFVVSNGGIATADNAQLAINLVSTDGIIAFDEYHQGFGTNTNRFFQFFAGTPFVAIFAQLLALTGLVFYSRSRRFARPRPEPEPDRRTKLEYISAMAELQRRARAYDLAMENVFRDFRVRAAKTFGQDPTQVRTSDLASLVAERVGSDKNSVFQTLEQCESVMHGEPVGRSEFVRLMGELRDLEIKLGIARQPRNNK